MRNKGVRKKFFSFLYKFIIVTAGCAIYASGVAFFLDPNNIVTGGLTGISMILSRFIPLNTGIVVLILNIPLFVIGVIAFGKSFILSTGYATALSSLLITLFEEYFAKHLPLTDDLLLSGLIGGTLLSGGLALVFRGGATTGGVDVIVKLLKRKLRHIGTGKIILALDGTVVIASAIVFRNPVPAMYAAISIVVGNLIFDKILYGFDEAKLVYVISSAPEAISRRVLNELEAGVTFLDGSGGFTGENKRVLLIAAKKQLFPKIKDIVRAEDKNAFMIVTSASEVFGEGFKETNINEI